MSSLEILLVLCVFFLKLPIDAMSGGEDDVVSDQGAAAETGAVDEDSDLVLELSGGGQIAADDATTVAGCLVVQHWLGAGHGPQVGPVSGLKFREIVSSLAKFSRIWESVELILTNSNYMLNIYLLPLLLRYIILGFYCSLWNL
jgi:hypothetical protein